MVNVLKVMETVRLSGDESMSQPIRDAKMARDQELHYTIDAVSSSEDLEAIKLLFAAYAKWLDLDLSFQDFSQELAALPGKYTPPTGQLLLARSSESGEALGCVGMRPLPTAGPRCCEMKRLYVLPAARGLGLGKALALRLIDEASKLGYNLIKLDTLSRMTSAIELYRGLGFIKCERYYDTPLDDTLFLELDLRSR